MDPIAVSLIVAGLIHIATGLLYLGLSKTNRAERLGMGMIVLSGTLTISVINSLLDGRMTIPAFSSSYQ